MTAIENFDTMAGEIIWDHSFPPPETVEKIYELLDFQRTCQLYLWSTAIVGQAQWRSAYRENFPAFKENSFVLAQSYEGRLGVLTVNQTSEYFFGWTDVKERAAILEIPPGVVVGLVIDFWQRGLRMTAGLLARRWSDREEVLVKANVPVNFIIDPLQIDEARLSSYLEAFRRLRESHGLGGPPDLDLVSRLDGVLVERSLDPVGSIDAEIVTVAAHAAVDELIGMRSREGARLATELQERLDALAVRLSAVEELAPLRLEAERERLRRSVAELAGGVDVDDDRLAREIAVLADRWDIREEIVRAGAHVEAFRDLLDLPDDEPVGKRLGFLSQELLREVNTIGSKGNDARIAHHVVEAKNELETMREQIENVE